VTPDPLDVAAWPFQRLGEAIERLGHRSGLSPRRAGIANPPPDLAPRDADARGRWIEASVEQLGLESEAVDTTHADVQRFLLAAAPALVYLPGAAEPRFLALLGARAGRVRLLGPDLRVHEARAKRVAGVIRAEIEAPLAAEVDRLLDEIHTPARRRAEVRAALMRERVGGRFVGGGWLFRLPPGVRTAHQARRAGLHRQLLLLVGAYAAHTALLLLAWRVLGAGVLGGRLDRGWLTAWALLLLTAVPARLLATWAQGRFAIGAGRLLKQRLLQGALKLDPEEIRSEGAGQFLSRIIESASVESLAINGGFLVVLACLELAFAALVLSLGAGGAGHVALLGGWVVLTVLVAMAFQRRRVRWTGTRLALTHALVENMVGHRTRLAQEPRERWHEAEDRNLEEYLQRSQAMDRAGVAQAGLARGWLMLGLIGLTPAFVSGAGSPVGLAIGLGGVLLGYLSLERLASGLSSLLGAGIAWRQISFLFHAAARPDDEGAAGAEEQTRRRTPKRGETLLEARELSFRYSRRARPVLEGLSLSIRAGDRLLLEGASGGGKSTLAALLMGLRSPESGLLLLGGLDRRTLGSRGWRRRVVGAPQFHENHVLTGTFAFNLLMGRRWPARPEDLREAEAVCRDLGLGELLERMPAGMQQVVGETGWRLSHGERSRLFMARALLQGADLIVLDESFASLDPESLERCLRCALERSPTLLVIAHP
jgi:ATP-binding cassette subfamily B protein